MLHTDQVASLIINRYMFAITYQPSTNVIDSFPISIITYRCTTNNLSRIPNEFVLCCFDQIATLAIIDFTLFIKFQLTL